MHRTGLKTLILTLVYPNRASYYDDWSDEFTQHPGYDCTIANIMGMKPKTLVPMIENFDAIIMLHACNADTLEYFAPLASVLGQRKRARLVSFVGNEFNSPYLSTPDRTALFAAARCDLVATQLLQEAGDYLYAGSGCRIVSVPHALNPAVFTPGRAARQTDIGVKGYRYPPYLGDDDRNRFVAYFADNFARWGLAADISYDKRLDRGQWAAFLQSCKGTMTTEAGSWYISPDDELIQRIYAHLVSKRSGPTIRNTSHLRRLARHLPSSVKSAVWKLLKYGPVKFEVLDDHNTTFAELNELFFKQAPRPPAYGKAISSRHFDAIGAGTCQIALRGRFNDILVADEHYLAIDADYANADETIERFKDERTRERIVQNARDHVLSAHTYRHRADTMLRLLTE
jgi:spore maturation protein CgeB